MSARLGRTVRAGLRGLSTTSRPGSSSSRRVGAYAAATVVLGTTLAVGLEYPRFIDRFVVKAESAQSPDHIDKNEKDGFRRQCLNLLIVRGQTLMIM